MRAVIAIHIAFVLLWGLSCAEKTERRSPSNAPDRPVHSPAAKAAEPPKPPPPDTAPPEAPGPKFEGDPPEVLPCGTPPGEMVCIPGGPFILGSDDGPEPARPQEVVWVQTFYMDKNEVTYGDYQACAARRKCDEAKPLYFDFNAPDQPMNGASWFAAKKYCEAHGKDLPTEAQWEKAARGTDGRLYPWGNEVATCELAVIEDASGKGCGRRKRGKHPEKGKVWPVGSKPPGPNGLYDMAGNSYEWVRDWYTESYAACGDACRGVDPEGPCGGEVPCKGYRRKVVRGGSWYWGPEHATTIYRRAHVPSNNPYHHFGFRCAAAAPAKAEPTPQPAGMKEPPEKNI